MRTWRTLQAICTYHFAVDMQLIYVVSRNSMPTVKYVMNTFKISSGTRVSLELSLRYLTKFSGQSVRFSQQSEMLKRLCAKPHHWKNYRQLGGSHLL